MTKREFNEKNIVKELAELLSKEEGDKFTEEDLEDFEVRLETGWDVDYYEVRIWNREYIVLENHELAEKLAKEYVEEDLLNERSIFNQDWLESLMTHKIDGQSFIEYASEDAVSTDGFAHFLGHYDGDYMETKSGFIVIRRN